jgi:hypothetical protein
VQGELEPDAVALPELPARTPRLARVVLADLALVYGLRLAACDDRPVPYAAGWAAKRLGCSRPTVWRALRWLVAAGVLEDCGELAARGKGNGTKTYLPGGAR